MATAVTTKGLVAKKVGMSRFIMDDGKIIPVTILEVMDQKVTKVLDLEKDGYTGYQIGYGQKSEKNLSKADIHRLRKANVKENYSKFCEFRVSEKESKEIAAGATLTAESFTNIEAVDVTGTSKGRGFQGAVKRWNASIGRMTHGSRFHRRPGSLGQCTSPGRVFKNKHQPGHMGVDKRTVSNVKVVKVDVDKNVIAVHGSVPGNKLGIVEIRQSRKVSKSGSK